MNKPVINKRKKKLNQAAAEALQPERATYRVPDISCPGLSLQVTPAGHKTWWLRFTVNGISHVEKLYDFNSTVLYRQVKKKAAERRREISDEEVDNVAETKPPKQKEQKESVFNCGSELEKGTKEICRDACLGELLGAFLLRLHLNSYVWFTNALSSINRHLAPVLNYYADPLALDARDCKALQEQIRAAIADNPHCRNSGIDGTNNVMRILQTSFNDAVKNEVIPVPVFSAEDIEGGGYFSRIAKEPLKTELRNVSSIKINPCDTVEKLPGGGRARDRVVTASELQYLVYCAVKSDNQCELDPLVATVLVVAFGFGARITEVLRMRREHLDLDSEIPFWIQPGELNKTEMHRPNPQSHSRPIVGLTKTLIDRQLRAFPDRDYIFSRDPHKVEHSNLISDALKNAIEREGAIIGKFVPRDMRRTAKTIGVRLGVPRDVLDRYQYHKGFSTTADRVYDQHDYYKEKFLAADMLASFAGGMREFELGQLPTSPFEIAYAGGSKAAVMGALDEVQALNRPVPDWIGKAMENSGLDIFPAEMVKLVTRFHQRE